MINNVKIFLLGFLVNACLWRLEQGQTEDILFPFIILVCLLLSLGLSLVYKIN